MAKSLSKSPSSSRIIQTRRQRRRFLDPDPISEESNQDEQASTTSSSHLERDHDHDQIQAAPKKSTRSPIPLDPPSSSSVPRKRTRAMSRASNLNQSSAPAPPPSPISPINPNLLSAKPRSNSKSPNKYSSRPKMAHGITLSERISAREVPEPAKRQTRAASKLRADDSKVDEKGKGKEKEMDDDAIVNYGNQGVNTSSGNVTDVTDVTQREASSMREAVGQADGVAASGKSVREDDRGLADDRDSSPLSELDETMEDDRERERSKSGDSQRSALLEELHVIHDEASQDLIHSQGAPAKTDSNRTFQVDIAGGPEESQRRVVQEERNAVSSSNPPSPSRVLAPSSSPTGSSKDRYDGEQSSTTSQHLEELPPPLVKDSSQPARPEADSLNPNQLEEMLPARTEFGSQSKPAEGLVMGPSASQETTHVLIPAVPSLAKKDQPSEGFDSTTPTGKRKLSQAQAQSEIQSGASVIQDPDANSSTLEASGSDHIDAGVGAVNLETGEQLLADLDANVFSDLSSPAEQRNQTPSPLRNSPAKRRRLGPRGASPNASPSRIQQRRILQRTGSRPHQALAGGNRDFLSEATSVSGRVSEAGKDDIDLDPDDDLFNTLDDFDLDLQCSSSPTNDRCAAPELSRAMLPLALPGLTSGAGIPLRSSSPNSIKQAEDRISHTGSSPSGGRNGFQRSSSPLHSFLNLPKSAKETVSSPGFSVGGDISRPASRPSAAAMASARQKYSSSPSTSNQEELVHSNKQTASKVQHAGFASAGGKPLKAREESLRKAAIQFSLVAAEVEETNPSAFLFEDPSKSVSKGKGKEKETEGSPAGLETPRAGVQPDRSRTPFGTLPHDNVAGSPKSKSNAGTNAPASESLGEGPSFVPGGFSKASQIASLPIVANSIAPPLPPLATPKAVRAIGNGLRKTFVTPSRVGQGSTSSSFSSGSKSRLGQQIPSTPANATPLRARALLSSNKSIKLGSTPRNPGNIKRTGPPKFKTPFKNGVPPASMSTPRSLPRASSSTSSTVAGTKKRLAQPVFDLTPRQRQSLSEYGIKPESVSMGEASFSGVSEDVFVILKDPSMAGLYAFTDENDNDLGPVQAHEMLCAAGANLVSRKWVMNHWSLIIWKLAAITRHKPTEDEVWFTWHEVCRQLKYRYEREVNLAQRSAIQRIQEQDSSSSLPMVLFVSGVIPFQKHPTEEEQGDLQTKNGVKGLPELELSDGWYRIRATIDEALARATAKGRIKVGVKLAITGARLNGGGEGTAVLDAFHSSFLSITGNSTSLARWDARLGFVATPFTATLRSLNPDGGVIARMDVVLTRVYDHAWVDVDSRGGAGAVPRGDEEEERLQREWERKRETELEKLQDEWSKKTDRAQSLREMIENEAEGLGEDYSSELFSEAEILLDKIKDSPSATQLLRSTSKSRPSVLPALVEASKRYCAEVQEEARSEIEFGIQSTCPARKVRDFRVVRFMDSHIALQQEKDLTQTEELQKIKIEQVDGEDVKEAGSDKIAPQSTSGSVKVSPAKRKQGEKRPEARTVQLQVWDVNAFGKNALKVGGRYTVTNLIPTQRSSWRGPDDAADVMLSTRRDSRWRMTGEVRIP